MENCTFRLTIGYVGSVFACKGVYLKVLLAEGLVGIDRLGLGQLLDRRCSYHLYTVKLNFD